MVSELLDLKNELLEMGNQNEMEVKIREREIQNWNAEKKKLVSDLSKAWKDIRDIKYASNEKIDKFRKSKLNIIAIKKKNRKIRKQILFFRNKCSQILDDISTESDLSSDQ